MDQARRRKHRGEKVKSARAAGRPYLDAIWANKGLTLQASRQLKTERASVVSAVLHAARRKNEDFLGTPFPAELNDLARTIPTWSTDRLESELKWTLCTLLEYADRLLPLIELKRQFEAAMLLGRYDEATDALNGVEKTGQSWWLYSMKCLLEQKRDGLEANKTFAKRAKDGTLSNWVQFLTYSLSQRAEDDMSAEEFETLCDGLLSESRSASRRRTNLYFQFRLNFHNFDEEEFLPDCLNIEESHALLDRYLTGSRVFQRFLIARKLYASGDFSRLLQAYARTLSDERVRVLSQLILPDDLHPLPLDLAVFEILHHYTLGEYARSLTLSAGHLVQQVGAFELYELAAKSAVRMGVDLPKAFSEESVSASILEATYHVIARNSRRRDALRYLHHLSHQLDSFPIADQLHSFYKRHVDDSTALRSDETSLFGAAVASPKLATLIADSDESSAFLDRLAVAYPSNAAVALFRATQVALHARLGLSRPSGIPETRAIKFDAYVLEAEKRFAEALVKYQELEARADTNPLLRSDAITGLYRCHFNLGNYFECATVLADAAVLNPDLVSQATVKELLDRYSSSTETQWLQNIAWPVLHYIADRDGIVKFTPEAMHDVLDDYLGSHVLEKPSQLRAMEGPPPQHLLVFLLRRVCTPEVLDSSIWFESQEEVEYERGAILEWLTELDPENSADYTAEIAELTARGKRRDLTHRVGHNKIFVDTEGIRASLPDSFRDRVFRCSTFALLNEGLRDGIAVVSGTTGGSKNVDVVATDEGFRSFKLLFTEVLHEFTMSNEYGLDANLSQRVRHGALLGELRALFEQSRLLTEQSEGEYARNEHWLKKLDATDTPGAREVLADLSRGVDTLARRVRDSWIQIKGPGNEALGLFDYDFNDEQLRPIFERVAGISSVDGFLDLIFDALWQRTEESLTAVRTAVTSTLREELNVRLDASVDQLASLSPPLDLSEYRGAVVTMKNQLEYGLEAMAAWFRVDEALKVPPFRLSELLDALLEQVAKYCGPSKLSVVRDVRPDRFIDGRLFRPFWDLLFIFFANAAKYARSNPAQMTVAVTQQSNAMMLSVNNETDAAADEGDLRSRAALAEEAASVGRPNEMFRREGRSGFPKVAKILRYDFECEKQNVRVSIDDRKWFCITVEMVAHGLYAEDTSN